MSTLMKLIIPLLDDNITKEDVSDEAKFVDGFLLDRNRPTLDNHVFLMYKCDISTTTALDRNDKFKDLQSLYSSKVFYFNQIPYKIYTFPRVNPAIRRILSGEAPRLYKDASRILKFWKGEDEDVNRILLYGLEELIKRVDKESMNATLPEKDYAVMRNIS